MHQIILAFAVQTISTACLLWVGMQVAKVEGTFVDMLVIAAISSFFQSVPLAGFLMFPNESLLILSYLGKLIGVTVMFVLICKWTDAEFWPDAVVMVVVANLVGYFGNFFLQGLLA